MPQKMLLRTPPMTAPLFELNPEQQAAASFQGGNLCVIAGAGTGKTQTLVCRAAALIKSGLRPYQICCLTYTSKAADNIRFRLRSLVRGGDRISAGTIHALSCRLLRLHGGKIGLAGFTILDQAESLSLLNLLRDGLGISFPKTVTNRQIADCISYKANTFTPLLSLISQRGPDWQSCSGQILQLQERHLAYKAAHGLLDYDDLLYKILDLIAVSPDAVADIRHVIVDEAQDLNPLQLEVLRALLSRGAALTCVGDPDQAIYAFRGSQPLVMAELAASCRCRSITLRRNYRSTQAILDLAARVQPAAPLLGRPGGKKPVKQTYATDADEARAVAAAVKSLLSQGAAPQSVAVLYSSSTHSAPLQFELQRLGISYVTRGGLRITDTSCARDLRALLRLSLGDDPASLVRLLQLLPGIGPAKALQLAVHLQPAAAPAKARPRVEALAACVAAMRHAQPAEAWAAALAWYEPHIPPHRRDDVEQLGRAVASSASVLDFLDRASLHDDKSDDGQGKVCLSTVHSSKGLEFLHVFIIGLSQGRFAARQDADEAARLLYVAITRAAETLTLTAPLLFQKSDRSWHRSSPLPIMSQS